MNKIRLLIVSIFICIMLSFFCYTYASETAGYITVNDTNVKTVSEGSNYTTEIVVTAKLNEDNTPNTAMTFSPTGDGVYTIEVTGRDRLNGQDLYYLLTDSSGKEVRLAAYYDEEKGNYYTFTSNKDQHSTTIDVYLKQGETYTLKLVDDAKSGANLAETEKAKYIYAEGANSVNQIFGYVREGAKQELKKDEYPRVSQADYNVHISVNDDANTNYGYVYQSDISSNEISADQKTKTENLETPLYGRGVEGKTDIFNGVTEDYLEDNFVSYQANVLEETFSNLFLAIGDFLVYVLNSVVGEEVTITALVYNQVDAVNPNFFDHSVSGRGATASIKGAINTWYGVFRGIAIAIYIVVLLVIGVQILLSSTSNGTAKAKELLIGWVKGVAMFVVVPYLIKYAFLLNEGMVGMLAESAGYESYKVGGSLSGSSEWSAEAIEFRSPEYVSNYTGAANFGSDEATNGYVKKIQSYTQNLDLMRIMRAYAGATKKFIYVIIWLILIGQLMAFIFQYYKRYFIIAFLIAIFPIICIFNAISLARGSKGKEFGSWMKELFVNIFIQFVQAIVYTIITSICLSIVKQDMVSSTTMNWLIIILAINFVSDGEKLLRKIMGISGSGGIGDARKGLIGTYGGIRRGMDYFTKGKSDRDKEKGD